jgi:hypothetical protein
LRPQLPAKHVPGTGLIRLHSHGTSLSPGVSSNRYFGVLVKFDPRTYGRDGRTTQTLPVPTFVVGIADGAAERASRIERAMFDYGARMSSARLSADCPKRMLQLVQGQKNGAAPVSHQRDPLCCQLQQPAEQSPRGRPGTSPALVSPPQALPSVLPLEPRRQRGPITVVPVNDMPFTVPRRHNRDGL